MKKYNQILVFFCLFSTLTASTSSFGQNLDFKIEPNPKTPWKSPSTASLQSMILPGAGYLYQDKLLLGYSVMASELVLAGVGTYFMTNKLSTNNKSPEQIKEIQKKQDTNKNIGLSIIGLAGAIHLFQFVHSGVLAHKSNKVNGYALNKVCRPYTFKLQSSGAGINLALNF
jgi:hypothetical protein